MKPILIMGTMLVLILVGCSIVKPSYKSYSGTYKCLPYKDWPSDSLILELNPDGLFYYYCFYNNRLSLDAYYDCSPATMGTWKICKKKIFLSSARIFDEMKPLIKNLGRTGCTDSLMIQIVDYSNNRPHPHEDFVIFKNDSIIYWDSTDESGNITLPKTRKNSSVPFLYSHIGQYANLNRLKGGYYYRLYYYDCFPTIFDNQSFKICGDTLVEKLHIKEKHRKYFHYYRKIK